MHILQGIRLIKNTKHVTIFTTGLAYIDNN